MNKHENLNSKSMQKRDIKIYTDYDIFKGKIRLIVENGMPKIIERDDAIELAHANGKNLVQIAYNKNDFPHAVCKIIDYGKFKYEQQKREKEAKKAAKAAQADVKEICFSIRIDDGDKLIKINHIKEFLLDKKSKVKITIKLLRREMNLLGMAKTLMREILNSLNGLALLDTNPTFNSGIMSCTIRPIK